MKSILILVLAVGCLVSAGAADVKQGAIIGIWRFVKFESANKKIPTPTGDMEMEFRQGGGYVMKYIAPKAGVTNLQTMQGKFTLSGTNRVEISLDNKAKEQYSYQITGDTIRMANLKLPVVHTLKRIDKFTLK
jgi:Lipocalin-like domain